MEDRLIELEMKVAFQEDGLHKLGEAVAQQERQIYRLRKDLDQLRAALAALGMAQLPEFDDEERPPHY